MNTSRFAAGASKFAHFAGLTRRSARAAEDDQPEDRDDDKGEDEDEPKGKRSRRAEQDDTDQRDEDEPKGKRSRRAEEDDDDKGDEDEPKGKRSRRAEEDDDDKGDEDEPKGKRSRRAEEDDDAAEDDDDDKQEMTGRSTKAVARRREQDRIGAILGHSSAGNNLALAVSLACETRMTRREAIAVMKSQPKQSRDDDDRGNRHARVDRSGRNVSLGSDASMPSGKQAIAAGWDGAFKKAGVRTR